MVDSFKIADSHFKMAVCGNPDVGHILMTLLRSFLHNYADVTEYLSFWFCYLYTYMSQIYEVNRQLTNDYMHSSYLPIYSDYLAKELYQASWVGHDQKVLKLLQRGAPPNSDYYTRKCRGLTPLHRACYKNHHRSAKLLIKYGAIVAATEYDDETPLHWACTHNSKACAQMLLEHNCPIGEPVNS